MISPTVKQGIKQDQSLEGALDIIQPNTSFVWQWGSEPSEVKAFGSRLHSKLVTELRQTRVSWLYAVMWKPSGLHGCEGIHALRTQTPWSLVPGTNPHLKIVRKSSWMTSEQGLLVGSLRSVGRRDTGIYRSRKGDGNRDRKSYAFLSVLKKKKELYFWGTVRLEIYLPICLSALCLKRSQKKFCFLKWHKI